MLPVGLARPSSRLPLLPGLCWRLPRRSTLTGSPEMHDRAMRVQMVCNGVLVAEVIVEPDDVDSFKRGGDVWSRFARAKYDRGKPIGGAVMGLASQPRYFNVPVGEEV